MTNEPKSDRVGVTDRGTRGRIPRATLLCSLLLISLAGCSQVGTLWYTFFGNPAVPPIYKPSKSPTLVLVENSNRIAGADFDADLVATQVSDELKHHNVCPLVDGSRIVQLRDTNPQQYLSMSIADLARTVGAKQVLYIALQDATGAPELDRPGAEVQAQARVRVVDVDTGAATWPLDNQAGYPLTASVQYDAQGTTGNDTHAQVLNKLSDTIAKLFYSYSPDSSDNDPTDKPHVMKDM